MPCANIMQDGKVGAVHYPQPLMKDQQGKHLSWD